MDTLYLALPQDLSWQTCINHCHQPSAAVGRCALPTRTPSLSTRLYLEYCHPPRLDLDSCSGRHIAAYSEHSTKQRPITRRPSNSQRLSSDPTVLLAHISSVFSLAHADTDQSLSLNNSIFSQHPKMVDNQESPRVHRHGPRLKSQTLSSP
ncbi:hypothetical protein K439DRAFT_1080563 [Ramaria rubella]|nr:hypothetical protein K439DRAFT_1080563 [Ramaria rubella]